MATSQLSDITQYLHRAVLLRDGGGMTDGQLLERFVSSRDETAFAALVRRHGSMVWAVCRRALLNPHDAEDAFQATFLVLVRKAASILPREMVANWLYGVAHQTALKARGMTAKRRAKERQVVRMPEPEVVEQDPWRDLRPVLDQELSQLPEKYRPAIILCDLEGKTRKEAARQLGVPEGTLSGWLTRGRTMLAKRLARRGLAVSGGGLAAILSQNAVSACVPTSVVSSTIQAVGGVAAGRAAARDVLSAKVATLTEGVLKAMELTKLKVATTVLLMLAAGVGLGVVQLTHAVSAAGQSDPTKRAEAGAEERPPLTAKAKKALTAIVYLDIEYPVPLGRASAVGAVVDRRGYILSAFAPLKGAKRVRVSFGDGSTLDAPRFVGNEGAGLAVLKLEKPPPRNLRAVRFAGPENAINMLIHLKVGAPILAARKSGKGSVALEPCFVTALGRAVEWDGNRTFRGLVQVDRHVDAGSPLLNRDGEIVGFSIFPSQKGSSLGFALPGARVEEVFNGLRRRVQRPEAARGGPLGRAR